MSVATKCVTGPCWAVSRLHESPHGASTGGKQATLTHNCSPQPTLAYSGGVATQAHPWEPAGTNLSWSHVHKVPAPSLVTAALLGTCEGQPARCLCTLQDGGTQHMEGTPLCAPCNLCCWLDQHCRDAAALQQHCPLATQDPQDCPPYKHTTGPLEAAPLGH